MSSAKKLDVNKIVENVEKLHSLPTIYHQLDKAINDPHSSTNQISAIISEDTSLTARLLKLANSAFFNFPSKVDTITMAVSIIGTRQIRDLALATSVIEMFDGIPENVINMESFWKHSIGCGVCARVLGTFRNSNNVETFFVAGLLHDLGSLAVYSQIPKAAEKILGYAKEKHIALIDVERKLMTADHATIGSMLLKKWKLPHHLVEAVQHHHTPSKSLSPSDLCDTIHIADIISTGLALGDSGDIMVPKLDIDALSRSKITDTMLSRVVKTMDKQYQDFVNIVLNKE